MRAIAFFGYDGLLNNITNTQTPVNAAIKETKHYGLPEPKVIGLF